MAGCVKGEEDKALVSSTVKVRDPIFVHKGREGPVFVHMENALCIVSSTEEGGVLVSSTIMHWLFFCDIIWRYDSVYTVL